MKHLLLFAQVFVKTANVVIARCFFRGWHGLFYVVRASRAARLFFLVLPIKFFIFGVVFAVVYP